MFVCSLIEELCAKEGNNKTGCSLNFEQQCSCWYEGRFSSINRLRMVMVTFVGGSHVWWLIAMNQALWQLICTLFSRFVVALSRPLPSRCWNLPLSTHSCQHLLFDTSILPKWWVILLFAQPASFNPMIWPLSNSDSCSKWAPILRRGIFSVLKGMQNRNV